jgi:hypothetical protein
LNRFAEEARQKLCTYTAHDLKKHELLRVARRPRQRGSSPAWMRRSAIVRPSRLRESLASVQGIFDHMSAYMEAPAAA